MDPRERLRLIVLGYAADGDSWWWGNEDHTELELTKEEIEAQKATADELQEIHPIVPFEAKGREGDKDKAEDDEDEDRSSRASGATIVPEGSPSKVDTRGSKARAAKDNQIRKAAGSRKEAARKGEDEKTVPSTGKSST